jgi:hypothetical protein
MLPAGNLDAVIVAVRYAGQAVLIDMHTGRPLTDSDYTSCCINTTDLLMMSMCLLETCRGLKQTYYIKELCVKLVTYQKFGRLF